ncbi:coiled-coil domain-containing protein 81 isoform X2 [Pleurodeles waltl]|uniref:coiled-coil domain-containing protein 81 isoform X2 n=1 Tax=Pleurodeles waltl TaxID=8319 RepID=UPI003709471F
MAPDPECGRGIFPTLPRLPEEDVNTIWACVSDFIERQMALQKGVHIAGLGTFTLSRQKIDVGNNKCVLLQRPVFVVSEKFAQTHGLKHTKIYATGDVPVVPLNFMALSLGSSFTRDLVEGCVKETLQLFSRSIAIKQNAEFTFTGIGVLIIRDGKVKMKFFKEFLHSMDGSGNLVKALVNRPGTCDSVMSSRENEALRPRSCSAVLFPRAQYNGDDTKAVMETITEEVDEQEDRENIVKCTAQSEKAEREKDDRSSSNKQAECMSGRRLLSRQTMVPAKVTEISMIEDVDEICKPKPSPERVRSPLPPKALKADDACIVTQVYQKRLPTPSCLGHCRAGQELCYLCMQRAQKNIPVYFHEERRKKEEDEERILQQYQYIKDQEALRQAQIKLLANKEQSQKIAAFNLGVSEAIRNQKCDRSTDFQNSYIFLKRPLTPPAFLKQEKYLKVLNKDVEWRKNKEAKMKQDKEILDRLEQVQLAEDLASQKAKRLKEKNERMISYRGSLDTQVKLKTSLKPAGHEPCVFEPLFGTCDMTNEKLAERRQKAEEVYREQLKASEDRKRMIIFNALMQQRKEADMLKKLKQETTTERAAQFDKMFKLQRALQEDWARSAEMKRQRDCEEEKLIHCGSNLVHEQCDKYRRCCQCKRRLSNVGETNIWCDSRYIPGSRIVI